MVKPNYAFAKRQRDLAKKAKNEEKRARKRDQAAKMPGPSEPGAPVKPDQ